MNAATPDRPTLEERDGHIVIRVPMQFKRIGGRKEIIVPTNKDASGILAPAVQKPLAIALARAHRWKDLLERQRFPSISALANIVKQDPSYVMRILRLTLLAPDIIEAILAGREPTGLSLERLVRTLPMDWSEQRTTFVSCLLDNRVVSPYI